MPYHETNEELERRELAVGDEAGTEPEDERDDEERHSLRHCIDEIAVQRGPVRCTERPLQAFAV